MNISIPDSVSYMKIPSNCRLYPDSSYDLLCNLNNGSPLFNGKAVHFRLNLDARKLSGTTLMVKANVFSTGDEQNDADNLAYDSIVLAEFSDVEISG